MYSPDEVGREMLEGTLSDPVMYADRTTLDTWAIVTTEVKENDEDFIVEHVGKWCADQRKSSYPISKRLLLRALYCFEQEHKEEYEMLMKEAWERWKKENGN